MPAPFSLRHGFALAAFVALSLGFSGCASSCRLHDRLTGRDVPAEFIGTLNTVEHPSMLAESAVLRDVETDSCRTFDRVIFRFAGNTAPGYKVEYLQQPILRCASGEAVSVAGSAWLEVRMLPAQGHTEAGQPTIANRNRPLNLPNLKQVVEVCDFEGHEAWVLGLNAGNRFRVTELTDPPRLVVDVKQ